MHGRSKTPLEGRRCLACRPVRHRTEPRQSVALLGIFVLAVASVAIASVVVRPSHARAFDLLHGSLFLDDDRAPVAVNLADGRPTMRLVDANTQVDAASDSGVAAVPLENGTLLLNRKTGEFNIVDNTGFVVKTSNGGVPLPKSDDATAAEAIAAGESAYIVQAGKTSTAVYLVGRTTVESARSLNAKVTPRAFVKLPQGSSLPAGSAVSANGDLWLLTGGNDGDDLIGARTLRQLHLPKNSKSGVELAVIGRGPVTGTAAIGVATRSSDGSGGDVVGVASATELEFCASNGTSHTAAVNGLSGVDQILPASNAQGRLSFLYHSREGWSLVSADTDVGAVTGPKKLDHIDPGARLDAPAASNGSLYTMDQPNTGELWSITATDGLVTALSGQARYPTQKSTSGQEQEAGDFSDSYVLARSDRVVFDSPDHVLALTVFTDGSHLPVTVDKSAAVDLNAAGGAAAINDPGPPTDPLRPDPTPVKATPIKPTPITPPAQQVDNAVNCKTTTQIPHISTITGVSPAARSVLLTWTYPLLDPQDCVPATYGVRVLLVSSAAPPAPAQLTVQGQQGVNINGLFPQTQYQITVTAYINATGTASAPVSVTTGREGPAAPAGVHTSTGSSGNWTISWHSCGTAADGCVPTASWNVIPQFCDGSGVSRPPATITVTGDQTLSDFTATLHADDSDLGRGLSFQVQGIGTQGDAGTSAGDGGCSYSWQPPNAAAMRLTASSPPPSILQRTSSSTFTLDLGPDPIQAGGGAGARFTYRLMADGMVVDTRGPTTATSVTFTGIGYGRRYTGDVMVSPPRHAESTATVEPVIISTRAQWPDISILSAKVTPDSVNSPHGTLHVQLGGLTRELADGETFDLVNSSLSCGNTYLPLHEDRFDPADPITADVDLRHFNGDCAVDVTLKEDGHLTTPPVFGGTESPSAALQASMPAAPTTPLSAADFTTTWKLESPLLPKPYSAALLQLQGSDPLVSFARNWTETLIDGDPGDCGSVSAEPRSPVSIKADDSCVQARGGTDGSFTVRASYTYAGSGTVLHTDFTVPGTPPTYVAPPPPVK